MSSAQDEDAAAALIEWYADSGVDEAVGAVTQSRFVETAFRANADTQEPPQVFNKQPPSNSQPKRPTTAIFKPTSSPSPDESVANAREIAQTCETMDALIAAIHAFEGCPLKAGARNTVVCDGVIGADLLVIGEAPGADEDRLGKPFVGRAGQLLDRMLAAIGRSRETDTLISNAIFWRPPGNRTPTKLETEVCRPFVDRLIELNAPKVIMLAGGAPMQALLGITGIMRARGTFREFEAPNGTRFPTLPVFHPAFLLRQPSHKRLAWEDLQTLQARLRED